VLPSDEWSAAVDVLRLLPIVAHLLVSEPSSSVSLEAALVASPSYSSLSREFVRKKVTDEK